MARLVVAIDQGTTGSRVYVYDAQGNVRGSAYRELTQYFPKPGWVEHDAAEIWADVQACGRTALKSAGARQGDVVAVGITNQRETSLFWDRATGKPAHRAIVWQCRRTADRCQQLKRLRKEPELRRRTGLVLDPYFSASKAEWLLSHVPGLAKRARSGQAAFGTIDSWLLYKLTGGAVHATDLSNASRTALFDIRKRRWDPGLLKLFGVPHTCLPKVLESGAHFGLTTKRSFVGADVPIRAVLGDQQAALYGQACWNAGDMKNTYGTGCFLLMNLGGRFKLAGQGLLTTLAADVWGKPVYALEGAVFIGGAALQWVRDGLGLIDKASQSEKIAAALSDNGGVYLVPAFAGLGAPWWDPHARGALIGLTRGTHAGHVVRAALESMAYQSADLVDAMRQGAGTPVRRLRVDGGASANDWLMSFQAGIAGVTVERPLHLETTALGVAMLAGLGAGLWKSPRALAGLARSGKVFVAKMTPPQRKRLRGEWTYAVGRVLQPPQALGQG